MTQGLTWKLSLPSASLAVEHRERVGRTGTPVPQAWQAGGGHCNFWETQWQAHLTEPRGWMLLVPLFQGMYERSCPRAPWTTGALLGADVVQNDHMLVFIHGSP